MKKINNLLIQKDLLELKIKDLQLQVKSIEERVTLLQQTKSEIVEQKSLGLEELKKQ